MKEQRFEELFKKYLDKSLTDVEETEFFQLLLDPLLESKRVQLFDHLYDSLPENRDIPEQSADLIFEQIIKKQAPVHRLPVNPGWSFWRRLAVAAAVILVMGVSGYFFLFQRQRSPEIAQVVLENDVTAPETSRAMITLSDGQKIFLDSALNGSLSMQGDVELVKLADGKILYEANGVSAGRVQYHTLSNPRGSKIIDMTLMDGSRVWLNAGSSITYPVPFDDRERRIAIDGEAYFEVARNATKPFMVHKGNTVVMVLGTHFNVNAYDDEADIRITLLEGAVQVISQQQKAMIKPGGQAIVRTDGVEVTDRVDLEQVMSWKDGYFSMKGTDLASLMRQIARWYDVQVVYKDHVPKASFGGSINREVNLSDVLNALEQYGIRSKLDQGKIIIY